MGTPGYLAFVVLIYGLTELSPAVLATSLVTSHVPIPSGCSHFNILVNGGFHHILDPLHLPPLNIPHAGELKSPHVRFIIGNFNLTGLYKTVGRAVSTAIDKSLPNSKEIQNTCRIDVDTTLRTNIEFLKAVKAKGFKLCTICDKLDGGTGTCDTIGICSSNSVCYRGHNRDYKSSDTSPLAQIHPAAYSHGCCDPAHDGHCHSQTYVVPTAKPYTLHANYTMYTCASAMCNADSSLHTKMSAFYRKMMDGHWASWSQWSACSHTCGRAYRTRRRTCTNPAPSNGGHPCNGTSILSEHCNSNECPVDGHWSSWSTWGRCSSTCGTSHKTRTRTCTHPAPAHGGHTCSGSSSSTTHCTTTACPVNGGWTHWAGWSACSVSCEAGARSRVRTCTNPAPAHGGATCSGTGYDKVACKEAACPVNGHWTSWSTWGRCSSTCGTAQKTRTRTCTHPAPAHGGHTCSGSSSSTAHCTAPACPVNGGWTHWAGWSACSVSCEAGARSRARTCTNPAPAHGGTTCSGSGTDNGECNDGACPVWSHWFYDTCSVTCGNGTTTRLRHCSSGHDEDCSGVSFEITACQGAQCPVDGGWGTWTRWSTCSKTCGEGLHTRHRTCNDPAPTSSGKPCVGDVTQTTACNTDDCPHWLAFTATSSCSVTCGSGVILYQRNCSTGHVADCTGSTYDERPCSRPSC